jgi:hypothetical protein
MKNKSPMYEQFELAIVKIIVECPDTYADIAKQFGLSPARVAQIAIKHNVRRPRGPKPTATVIQPSMDGLMEAN